MIQTLSEWSSSLTQISPFEDLRNDLVAIEAGEYLRSKRLVGNPPFEEPLLAALGGIPFTLRNVVKKDIEKWKEYGITPVFVFSGLDLVRKEDPFRPLEEVSREVDRAWKLYSQNNAQDAVKTFGSSGAPKVEDFYRFLQLILREDAVDFQIAPYSAAAQLAYLVSESAGVVDVVSGSADLLLWDIDRAITQWDFKNAQFTWIKRGACMTELGSNISPDIFVDACLLSGSAMLPPLPQLLTRSPQKSEIKRAVELIVQFGRSGHAVCQNYKDEPQFQKLNYMERYQKTRMAVKHHVIFTTDGKASPLNQENLPNDMHNFVGQRLPDELYYYLTKGVVGTRVLNWITSGEILEFAPLDGGSSEDYRRLVKTKLSELRVPTLALLSQSLHRYYQNHNLSSRCWFEPASTQINIRDQGDLKRLLQSWRVSSDMLDTPRAGGLVGSCIAAFKSSTFASKSIASMPANSSAGNMKPLNTKEEVLRNSIWRLLQIRGYVNEKHKLTDLGEMLSAAVASANDRPELEASVFLAIELLRLELLNAKSMFDYDGAPVRGTDADKRNSLLVSRVASFGSLQHGPIGFTGPLSRHLLGYNSMVSAVRSSLRDLAEVCLVTILLNGEADRELDLIDLGLELPFLLPNDAALGLATKTYLEELLSADQPVQAEHKKAAFETMRKYFPYASDFAGDLQTAFAIWDAVYAGVQAGGKLVKDRKLWEEANTWLETYR